MLSPCVGQVAHALLTRPPLGCASLGFSTAPFDLHVLGTPPAFILSQDQTLMFVSPASSSGFFVSAGGLPPAGASPVSRFRASSECLPFLEFSGLHYCLFVKVHLPFPPRQPDHNTTLPPLCQLLFLIFFFRLRRLPPRVLPRLLPQHSPPFGGGIL